MSTINLRIAKLVQHFSNGNNSDFGNKIGVNEANIRNYINGTEPKFGFLEKICKNFEINYEWLLLGQGNMLKEDTPPKDNNCDFYKEIAEERAYTIKIQKQIIDTLTSENDNLKKQTKSPSPASFMAKKPL